MHAVILEPLMLPVIQEMGAGEFNTHQFIERLREQYAAQYTQALRGHGSASDPVRARRVVHSWIARRLARSKSLSRVGSREVAGGQGRATASVWRHI